MATVPRLEMTGTVGGALPSVRQTSVASPELFAEQGAKDMAFGDAMMKASDPIARIALEEAEKTAVSKVQEARTELGNRTMTFFEDMRKNNVGAASAGVTQSFRDWHKKQVEEIGKNLPGTDVQRAFLQQASQHGLAARGEVANFEHSETTKYRTDTYNRTNDNLVVQAATATTDLAYIDARNSIVANVQARAMTEKWDEKQTEDNMRDALSKMHEARAKALATDVNGAANPKAALEYIKGVDPKEVNPLVRAQLTAGLKAQNDKQQALDFASETLSKMLPSPSDTKTPIDEKAIDAALLDKFKDNPDALALARHEKDYRIGKVRAARKEVEDLAGDRVLSMLAKGTSFATAMASPDVQLMDPKAVLGLQRQNRMDELQRAQLAYTQEGRSLQKLQREQMQLTIENAGSAGEYSNPETLRAMTRQSVNLLRTTMGNAHADRLLHQWDSIHSSDAKFQEAKLDHSVFMAAAIQAGVIPSDGSKTTPEQKARVGVLQADIKARMDVAIANNKGKQLSPGDRQVIIQQAIDDKVLVKKPWWGDDTYLPVGALTINDFDKIPEIERKLVEAAIRDADRNAKRPSTLTKENILRNWRGLHQRPEGFPIDRAMKEFGPKRATNPRGDNPITKIQSD